MTGFCSVCMTAAAENSKLFKEIDDSRRQLSKLMKESKKLEVKSVSFDAAGDVSAEFALDSGDINLTVPKNDIGLLPATLVAKLNRYIIPEVSIKANANEEDGKTQIIQDLKKMQVKPVSVNFEGDEAFGNTQVTVVLELNTLKKALVASVSSVESSAKHVAEQGIGKDEEYEKIGTDDEWSMVSGETNDFEIY